VTYEIEQAGEAVRLTMSESHDRPLDDDILSGGRQGWPALLSSLKSLLETGKPLVVKMGPPERMLAALKKLGIKTPEGPPIFFKLPLRGFKKRTEPPTPPR